MSTDQPGDVVRAELGPDDDLVHLVSRDGKAMVVNFDNARDLVDQLQTLIVTYDMPQRRTSPR